MGNPWKQPSIAHMETNTLYERRNDMTFWIFFKIVNLDMALRYESQSSLAVDVWLKASFLWYQYRYVHQRLIDYQVQYQAWLNILLQPARLFVFLDISHALVVSHITGILLFMQLGEPFDFVSCAMNASSITSFKPDFIHNFEFEFSNHGIGDYFSYQGSDGWWRKYVKISLM